MSLHSILNASAGSLDVFSRALQVAGNNISNASTPGYIRDQLVITPSDPQQLGGLNLGTGVQASGVQQVVDTYLETRIYDANSSATASAARLDVLQQLEAEVRELGTSDLSTSFNNFLAALDESANEPESPALRQLAVAEGVQFAETLSSLRGRVEGLQTSQRVRLESLTTEANTLVQQIYDLNPRIAKLENGNSQSSEAGALRSQRYSALNRLSEIVPVKFTEDQQGQVSLFTGNQPLILGGQTQQITVDIGYDSAGNSELQIQVSETKAKLSLEGGELGGVYSGHAELLQGFINDLDTFGQEFISVFNQIHASGEGVDGFTEVSALNEIADPTAALNAAGLDFTPVNGGFELKVLNTTSGITQTTNIDIDLDGIGTETSLNDLQAALDAVSGISASITPRGELEITADSSYEFRFANDTSGTLAALGINTFFTGSSAADIGVNSAVIQNSNLFATGQGGGPSDNSNLLELSGIQNQKLSNLGGRTLEGHYQFSITTIAQTVSTETTRLEGLETFQSSLLSHREQISGVSLDEETVRILEFQRAYQASARVISVVDELFSVLVNL